MLSKIQPGDDRYEIIADEFDRCLDNELKIIINIDNFESYNLTAASFINKTLATLVVFAAFDGVYSENEKKLIRRFVRRWNNRYKNSGSFSRRGENIEESAVETLETALLRLCTNENKRREIRVSSKTYQQITLELSAIAKDDEEIINRLAP